MMLFSNYGVLIFLVLALAVVGLLILAMMSLPIEKFNKYSEMFMKTTSYIFIQTGLLAQLIKTYLVSLVSKR